MSIPAILSLVLPFLLKIGGNMLERFLSHGVSTLQGTVAGGAVFTILTQAHCDLGLLPASIVAGIAAVPGFLATDADKKAPNLIPSVKEVREMVTQPNVLPNTVLPNTVDPMNP